jgi:aminopeptidase N
MLVSLAALLCAAAGPAATGAQSAPVVHHDLTVSLDPAGHRLKVHDRIRLPGALALHAISLNADLAVQPVSGGLDLRLDPSSPWWQGRHGRSGVAFNIYHIGGATAGQDVTGDIDYEGIINYPVRDGGGEYARAFAESPGLIEPRGVYLAGSTRWLPHVDGVPNALVTYTLTVELPAGWKSISQGERTGSGTNGGNVSERWSVATPTEEVHLIAAPFTEYSRDAGAVKAMAFLRTPDPALAGRYLDATAQYLAMYQSLLGPYPYSKFALVENFWETGYGMPSFTLLGEQVIRFPFILHSSYPHELLHNWWGNGVFVDPKGGNWSEGLTAYLADHLLAEQRGQGADRRAILQRVTDYVTRENDFPPSRFLSRHDAVTEAIGYGKTAMMWNMLRDKVGDDQFIKALRAFYRDNRFREASYDDIEKSFEAVTGRDLRPFFDQWVKSTGTPDLRLDNVESRGNHLEITLSQAQVQPGRFIPLSQVPLGRVFALDVPVVIATDRGVETRTVAMREDSARVDASFDLDGAAQRVEIDPQFQLYRRLSPFEVPPALSKAFGAGKVLIVMNAQSASTYAGLVKAWSRDGVETVMDTALDALPADRAVWVLGADNKFAPVVADAIKSYGASLDAAAAPYPAPSPPGAGKAAGRSLVAAARHPANPAFVVIFVSAPSEAAANALARKLPHYGKYSWLVFSGDEATNEGTGEWPVRDTPLARNLTPDAKPIKLTPRKALAEIKPAFDIARMKADVEWLAAPEREGRGPGGHGLEDAAGYIEGRFESLGLAPMTSGGRIVDRYSQRFTVLGENGQSQQVRNIIGVVPGMNPALQGQALIVSAHYDHLGFGWPDARAGAKGQLHPGADDNASGIAVMLELARLMVDAKPERSIIFAAFSGEEEGLQGSRTYVTAARQRGARFPLSGHIADLNLDTVGRLGDGRVTVFGAGSARELPFIFMGAGAATGIPVQTSAQDLGGSDDRAFVEAGVPAVQLFASTAEDYHRPSDTADKIDYAGLGKVAAILKEAVDYLAERAEPLHFSGSAPAAAAPAPLASERGVGATRRAATGIVPDMTDRGDGVRVGGVQPGSGAEAAGIKPGDRLLALGGVKTSSLKALADALRELQPGQTVEVEFARDAAMLHGTLRLGER